MSWSLLGPVAGYMPSLSDAARAEISRRFPSLSVDQISDCFGEYMVLSKARAAEPPAAEIIDEIDRIRAAATKLTKSLSDLSAYADRSIREAGLITRRPVHLESLVAQLADFKSAAQIACQRSPRGRRIEPRTMLVRALAIILHENGLPVDQKPKGTLVAITDIVLREAGETPGDVRRIVQQALRKWQVRFAPRPKVAT